MSASARGPIRVLELRAVRGTGGGPDKTILVGAARADPRRVATTVCYLRADRDPAFTIGTRAGAMGLDYVEIPERHPLDCAAWRALRQLVRARRIDIVHAHDYKTDLLAWGLARAEGVLPLATAHGWSGHSLREMWLYYPADRLLLSRFPRLVAVSDQIKRMLVAGGTRPARVTTILNGIDHGAFRRDPLRRGAARRALGLGDADVVIGSVGRLEREKRFDLLIDAVAHLRRTRPGAQLVIAGEGSLRRTLDQRARQLLPAGACRLLGHRTDIVELHHAFDVFVQTSDHEGAPNSVLEAMALETPVVTTDAGGTAELLHPGAHGLVVPCGDVPALAGAIDRTLGEPAATAARVAAARRRIEETLSFDARTRALERVYEEMMEAPLRGRLDREQVA